jgi:uncharacterized protein (TIGR02444 family)
VLVQCAREHLPDSPLRVIMWKSPWSHLPVNEKNPGVEAACLTLQDEFDLDVNIVLFCLWAGAAGPGRLTAEEISECITRGGRWQREVVQRLRHIRRTLKHDALGATPPLVEVFRPRAQNLELAAEHAQQLLLASIVPESRGVVDSSAAVDNLRAYFNETGLAADGNVREAVLIILNQAFADMDPIDIEALWTA